MDGTLHTGIIKFYDPETQTGRVLVNLFYDPDVLILKDFNFKVYQGRLLRQHLPVWVTIYNSEVINIDDRACIDETDYP